MIKLFSSLPSCSKLVSSFDITRRVRTQQETVCLGLQDLIPQTRLGLSTLSATRPNWLAVADAVRKTNTNPINIFIPSFRGTHQPILVTRFAESVVFLSHTSHWGLLQKKVRFETCVRFRRLVRFGGKLHHEKSCKRTNLHETYQLVGMFRFL